MRGWIKLYRDITEHWIYQDAEYLKVWIEMLVRARHSDDAATELIEGQLVTIEQGEFIFGRPGWSKRLGVSEQKLRTLLKKLINDDMIELTSRFNKFSLYRIKNYQNYNQQNNQHNNQQTNQQETAPLQGEMSFDDQHNNQQNNQQINPQVTSSQPANNQQPTTKEECKERKNVKNDLNDKYMVQFDEFWKVYPKRVGRQVAEGRWRTLLKEKVDPNLLIACARNYGELCKKYNTENQFILHPSTFLNKQRYMDYAELNFDEPVRKTQGGYNRNQKPALPIVERGEQPTTMSQDEIEQARALAQALDEGRAP